MVKKDKFILLEHERNRSGTGNNVNLTICSTAALWHIVHSTNFCEFISCLLIGVSSGCKLSDTVMRITKLNLFPVPVRYR